MPASVRTISILIKEETDFSSETIQSRKYMLYAVYVQCIVLPKFFSTENGNFCENIQIRRPLSIRVLTRSHLPNRCTSQSKIEDSASVC